MTDHDVVIIGAGGAGLMCALTAAQRGRRTLVVDHGSKIGEKIRISGGGRCNFTNQNTTPANFLSENPRFCVSALARFGPRDFIDMVERHGIPFHEKTLGQLFCDNSSRDIIKMLVAECDGAGVGFQMETRVSNIHQIESGFSLRIHGDFDTKTLQCSSVVIATGGKSIPKIGATDFGLGIARQFGLNVVIPRPGLVPFVFSEEFRARYAALSGLSVRATVRCGGVSFTEALLFTHRGLSGPAILQASSYWRTGDTVSIDLSPETDVFEFLTRLKKEQPKQSVQNTLVGLLPRRLALCIVEGEHADSRLADTPDKVLRTLADTIHDWKVTPLDTEGYRTAEVTVGGVDTAHLSSKTMECREIPGLYFIGEVVDVTGHLGGYNFQWAWASGHASGSSV